MLTLTKHLFSFTKHLLTITKRLFILTKYLQQKQQSWCMSAVASYLFLVHMIGEKIAFKICVIF